MTPSPVDLRWMGAALDQARIAEHEGDVPVGAVMVHRNEIVSRSSNRTVRDQDPTAHAEIIAIRETERTFRSWRLDGCTLYVTLEPCAMCAGAIVLSRLDRLVFGAYDDKAGMVGSIADLVRHPKLNHRAEVLGGVCADASGELLRTFFKSRRTMAE